MSLALIEHEIRRFLRSPTPEVLCIKGSWGVGKTYAWKRFLEDEQNAGRVGLKSYSYVSLFGLNALEELRYSIFENTVTGAHIVSGPNTSTFEALFTRGNNFGRRLGPAANVLFNLFNRKGVSDIILKSAFLSVREQIICLDDLERAGKGLDVRDVLGLISFLKEERKCKVVLLLNEARLQDKQREEFNNQLEKVADISIQFALRPEEASDIALASESVVAAKLRPRIAVLKLTNIRVIKRIERIAVRLSELLAERKDTTVEQAMTTLVLAGWAINQPGDAPTLDFIRKYNRIEIQIHRGREEVGEEKQRWREALADYPYAWTDDFDEVIIDGVALGYFDEGRLKAAALAAENRNRDGEHNTAFSRAWRDLYHGSLVVDDDEFLDELHRTAIQDAKSITPLNINSAIRILRDNGRGHQADDIITKYIHAREEEGREFFKIDRHHFSRDDRVDDRLRAAFADRLAGFVDARTPIEALRYMIENHTRDDPEIEIFSRLTSDDFEQLFESLRGDDVGKGINSIFRLGRADHEKSAGLLAAATEALRKIAAKSPLRRQKLRRFGIELDAPPVNDADN